MKAKILSILLSFALAFSAHAGIDNYQYQITTAKNAAISTASADATTKANAAQAAAISTASGDATTKANAAQAAAISTASGDATTKANNANTAAQSATLALFTTGQSKAVAGSQPMAGGLILKWGQVTIASTGGVTFPVAFPTALFNVQITAQAAGYNPFAVSNTRSVSGFTVLSNTGVSTVYDWFAIGY